MPSFTLPDSPWLAPIHTDGPSPGPAARGEEKPCGYRITATIPHRDALEPLRACVELLRLQTEATYVVVIDIGSTPAVVVELERLRDEAVEIHYLRPPHNGDAGEWLTKAYDLALILCRTEFLYLTQPTCFLRRRDYLEGLMTQCDGMQPVAGYGSAPREGCPPDSPPSVSLTSTLLHVSTLRRLGVSWSAKPEQTEVTDAAPEDTRLSPEVRLDRVLRAVSVQPVLIGQEVPFGRHVDENLDQPATSSPPPLRAEEDRAADDLLQSALAEAWARATYWRSPAGYCEERRRRIQEAIATYRDDWGGEGPHGTQEEVRRALLPYLRTAMWLECRCGACKPDENSGLKPD